jgi:hypothetical protein
VSRHTLTGRRLSPRTYRAAQTGLTLVAAASAFLSVLTASVGWLGMIGAGLVGWTLWPGWRVTLTCSDPGCARCATRLDQNGTEILPALKSTARGSTAQRRAT